MNVRMLEPVELGFENVTSHWTETPEHDGIDATVPIAVRPSGVLTFDELTATADVD